MLALLYPRAGEKSLVNASPKETPTICDSVGKEGVHPISDEVMREIIKLQLGRIETRLDENHGAKFSCDDAVVNEIANRCKEVESGARNVDHILTRTLLPEMSGEFLARMASGTAVGRVHVAVSGDGKFQYTIS